MPRILIISGFHVCHNPRVLKEADALAAAGYEVEVLGARLVPELAERDRELMRTRSWRLTPVVDLTSTAHADRWQRFKSRFRTRVAGEFYRRFGWSSGYQLGYAGPELFRAALARQADLYRVHLEQALWVGSRLLDAGRPVGIDMEDWYSEDLPDDARASRPGKLLNQLERRLLQGCVHRTTTSQCMSEALSESYACPPPTVVYNTFAWAERDHLDGQTCDRRDPSLPSVYWFSQTIGPGRGLEDLFAALPRLARPVELHLRGAAVAGLEAWLDAHIPASVRSRVHVHSLVPNDELISRIAEHDVGFAGEVPYCQNKDLTASNKVFHYMLGGAAVAASGTRGQREVLDQAPEAGVLYEPGNVASLVTGLDGLLASPERLRSAKEAALEAARTRFCWELDAAALVASLARVVPEPSLAVAVR